MDRHAAAAPGFAYACCIAEQDPRRDELEYFVRRAYRLRYGARLGALMPRLLAFADQDGGLDAAVGLRFGPEGPLFVEHYLDELAELALARELGEPVARSAMVELGNFAAATPGAARRLILSVIPLLGDTGVRWVLFVATRQLRNAFGRLGIATRELAPARAERLGGDAARWGRYYCAQPVLVFGDLHEVLPRPAAPRVGADPARAACGAVA